MKTIIKVLLGIGCAVILIPALILLFMYIAAGYYGLDMFGDSHIPAGYIRSEEHWDKEAFQDSIDYCIYYYDTADHVESASEFGKVTEGDIEKITGYFQNFRQWMQTAKRLDEYSFDPECISAGDYCYIKTKEGEPIGGTVYGEYDYYTVYFFDVETLTLYYIHSNI